MKRIQVISRMLAVAALLVGSASFGNENRFHKIQDGHERIVVRGSSFVLGNGASKELRVPGDARDLSQVLIQANTRNCAESKILVTVASDSHRREARPALINGQSGWYFLEFNMERARTITVTHECGWEVNVSNVYVDVGKEAIDCVFDRCKTGQCDNDDGFDLSKEIIDRMPDKNQYYYLLETLHRLALKTVKFLELGDDKVKAYIVPLSRELIRAKTIALVNKDGSALTLKALTRVRGLMTLSEGFFLSIANTAASRAIGEAFFTVGALIDDKADIDKDDINGACAALTHEAQMRQAFQNANQGQQQQQPTPVVPKQSKKGQPVLPAPTESLEDEIEEIPTP